MNAKDIEKAMTSAGLACAEEGARFTQKRQMVLRLLLSSSEPLSAYELADEYQKQYKQSMPAMSVYRILEFLERYNLVHKLSTNNKYLACSHIACSHAHEMPQFLICQSCQKVAEINIQKNIVKSLRNEVQQAGFSLLGSQLELECLCSDCDSVKH